MPRERKQKEAAAGGAPSWMVTYGDLMSLLLTFFVLLLSFSSVKVEDFKQALESVRREIFFLDFDARKPEVLPPIMETFDTGEARLRGAAQRIKKAAAALNLDLDVSVAEESEGLRITIQAPVLFSTGEADLRPEGREILRHVLNELIQMPNAITIEGHTDNIPIRTAQFPSNWELSTSRAISVAKFFIEEGGMQPGRLAAAGFSEYHPVASNDTPEGRQRNRRIELFVYKDKEAPR